MGGRGFPVWGKFFINLIDQKKTKALMAQSLSWQTLAAWYSLSPGRLPSPPPVARVCSSSPTPSWKNSVGGSLVTG